MLCLFRISQDSWKASPEKILHNTRGVGPTPARHPALKIWNSAIILASTTEMNIYIFLALSYTIVRATILCNKLTVILSTYLSLSPLRDIIIIWGISFSAMIINLLIKSTPASSDFCPPTCTYFNYCICINIVI